MDAHSFAPTLVAWIVKLVEIKEKHIGFGLLFLVGLKEPNAANGNPKHDTLWSEMKQ